LPACPDTKKIKDIPGNVLYLRHISRDSDDVDKLPTTTFYLIAGEKKRFFKKNIFSIFSLDLQ